MTRTTPSRTRRLSSAITTRSTGGRVIQHVSERSGALAGRSGAVSPVRRSSAGRRRIGAPRGESGDEHDEACRDDQELHDRTPRPADRDDHVRALGDRPPDLSADRESERARRSPIPTSDDGQHVDGEDRRVAEPGHPERPQRVQLTPAESQRHGDAHGRSTRRRARRRRRRTTSAASRPRRGS